MKIFIIFLKSLGTFETDLLFRQHVAYFKLNFFLDGGVVYNEIQFFISSCSSVTNKKNLWSGIHSTPRKSATAGNQTLDFPLVLQTLYSVRNTNVPGRRRIKPVSSAPLGSDWLTIKCLRRQEARFRRETGRRSHVLCAIAWSINRFDFDSMVFRLSKIFYEFGFLEESDPVHSISTCL